PGKLPGVLVHGNSPPPPRLCALRTSGTRRSRVASPKKAAGPRGPRAARSEWDAGESAGGMLSSGRAYVNLRVMPFCGVAAPGRAGDVARNTVPGPGDWGHG